MKNLILIISALFVTMGITAQTNTEEIEIILLR